MNQKWSWGAFITGLVVFFLTCAELLAQHHAWSDLTATPAGASHLFVMGAAFTAAIGGALGIQIPRASWSFGDRKGDPPPPKV